MKNKLLFLGVLMGLALSSPSFALQGGDSSNKTTVQTAIVFNPGLANGSPAAFITGTTNAQGTQFCASAGATTGTGAATGNLSLCGGAAITGINLSGGGSGGIVSIYDASTNQTNQNFQNEVGNAECVFEATVAANTQNYYDLHNAPIMAQNGVVVMASSTSGVVVYTSNGINNNH